ncbi:hypothetical protein [Gudongella sp. DL1XJH-153]|uniref:hypothetical protein n=1 Tax=Gudongella sp. DL1XJH-153 TaxID=3409804 RepID=UPI003BB7ACD9
MPNKSKFIFESIIDAIPIWLDTFIPIILPLVVVSVMTLLCKLLLDFITKTHSRLLGESARESRTKIKGNNNIIDLISKIFKIKA